MKIDFAEKKDTSNLLGHLLERAGFALFALTFWMPWGFSLGGDPMFLGPYRPELEIVFPLCGLGVLLLFFGKFLSHTQRNLSSKEIFFLLLFLVVGSLASIFSLNPESSLLSLIVWSVGFLSMSTENSFLIKGSHKRLAWALSIFVGVLLHKIFPEAGISGDILGLASLLGIVFLFQEGAFFWRPLFLILFVWGIFESGNLALIGLSFFFLLTIRFWLPASRLNTKGRDIFYSAFFLLGLSVWGFASGSFPSFSFYSGLPLSFFNEFQRLFFGAGEGQFLPALAGQAKDFLLPADFHLPSSGFILVLYEKGFVGLFFLLLLLVSPYLFFQSRAKVALLALLGAFLLISPDAVAMENGILFLMVFLFAHESHRNNSLREISHHGEQAR
jgi:hypothetical protein